MRLVVCNCPRDHAERIARTLVEEGRAACVSATEVRSTYRWEGKICVDPEVTLFIKVAAASVGALRDRLRALHPYDLPEILALPVSVGESLGAYVNWVRRESDG